MNVSDHIENVVFPVVVWIAPFPSFLAHRRKWYSQPSHHCGERLFFLKSTKGHALFVGLELVVVRVLYEEERHLAFQIIRKHGVQFKYSLDLFCLDDERNYKKNFQCVYFRLIEEVGVLEGGSGIRVLLYDSWVKQTKLFSMDLLVVRFLQERTESLEPRKMGHLWALGLFFGGRDAWGPEVWDNSTVPLI